jgi:hypothetical protein
LAAIATLVAMRLHEALVRKRQRAWPIPRSISSEERLMQTLAIDLRANYSLIL